MVIYTTDSCAPCSSLKKFLDRKGVSYRVLNADEPEHAAMLWRLTGARIVSVTMVEGHAPIIGLNYSAISQALRDNETC